MRPELITEITDLSTDAGERLRKHLSDQQLQIEEEWIERLHAALKTTLEQPGAKSLAELRAHCDGARLTLAGILRHLGAKQELLKHRQIIQTNARFYLAWLGLRDAHRVLVNTVNPEREGIAAPDEVHEHFRHATYTLDALRNLLDRIALTEVPPLAGDQRLGAVVTLLMLRDGVVSFAELRMVLQELAENRLARAEDLWYVVGPTAPDNRHIRRAYLSRPTVVAALSWDAVNIPNPKFTKTVNAALAALSERLEFPEPRPPLCLRTLKREAAAYLRLNPHMVQHVADYIEGDLVSDSLAESCLARLLDMAPIPVMLTHELTPHKRKGNPATERLRREGFITDMVNMLQKIKEPKKAKQAVLARIQKERSTEKRRLMCLIIDWTEWMLEVNGIACSTAAMHLTNFSRGLFPVITDLDVDIVNPDDWELLVENMLRRSSRYDKLRDAIAKFAEFLTYRVSTRFTHNGYASEATVNAWCLSEAEKDAAIAILRRRYDASEPGLTEYAAGLIELAYYLGTRRWELLGLHATEVVGKKDPWLMIRPNRLRSLKTDCSERNIPMRLVTNSAFLEAWKSQCAAQKMENPSASIAESLGIDLAKREKKLFLMINSALQHAVGSTEVSFHSLRHSAACRTLLSLYWPFMGLEEMEKFPYFAEIASASRTIREILIRENTADFLEHKTVSTVLGHLSYRTTAGHYFHHYCLLRKGLLKKVHGADSWLESPEDLVGLSGRIDLIGEPAESILSTIAAERPSRLQVYAKKPEDRPPLTPNADNSFRLRLRAISEMAIQPLEKQDQRIQEFIPDATDRAQYLAGLQNRTELITSHYARLGIKLAKVAKSALIMPTDVPSQEGLHTVLSHLSQVYPTSSECRKLAMSLLTAATFMERKEHGAFAFKSGEEARQILKPLMTLLTPLQVRIYHWNKVSKRLPGERHPKLLREDEAYADSLDALPNHRVGTLIVRFEPQEDTSAYTPRLLIWLIPAMYAAYGRTVSSWPREPAA